MRHMIYCASVCMNVWVCERACLAVRSDGAGLPSAAAVDSGELSPHGTAQMYVCMHVYVARVCMYRVFNRRVCCPYQVRVFDKERIRRKRLLGAVAVKLVGQCPGP